MSVADKTAPSQNATLTFEYDLHHGPKKVWRALTDPELLTEWLLPVVGFELQPGAAFAFRAPPQPGWDGVVKCRMLEIDAPHRISYAWVVGDIDTIVTFTLTPTASGTRLSLVQSGFKPEQKHNFGGARYGWRLMGTRLVDLLAKSQEPVEAG
jgi:uncharacterized protein YndB with AHSA1/START domain